MASREDERSRDRGYGSRSPPGGLSPWGRVSIFVFGPDLNFALLINERFYLSGLRARHYCNRCLLIPPLPPLATVRAEALNEPA